MTTKRPAKTGARARQLEEKPEPKKEEKKSVNATLEISASGHTADVAIDRVLTEAADLNEDGWLLLAEDAVTVKRTAESKKVAADGPGTLASWEATAKLRKDVK